MKKSCSLFRLLLPAICLCMRAAAQTPTVVFSDNFDRASFTTGSTGGVPATTYKFTTGSTSTISTSLVSGTNYKVNINSGTAANRALFYAPLSPYSTPFSRKLSANVGLITWTFNMRTSTAVTTTAPLNGAMAGGVDLCSNAAGNIYNGSPTGYGVVFNSSATGGVDLVRFSAGMATNVVLITQTTTMPKTDYYSVRVTYDPLTGHWSLYVRDDGASGFSDPSSGVTVQQGSTITDVTYVNNVMVNFGALYTWTAGTGKTMSVDNYNVTVTIPPCAVPGAPTGLSYSNTATASRVSFTPPGTAPSGYILVMSPGTLAGGPVSGQAVTIGTSVGTNGTIVGSGTGSPITTSSALTGNTNYTMTLFPYNNTGCSGGPVFNTGATSTNITTCPNAPVLTSAGTPTANTIPGVTWAAPAPGGGAYSSYTYLLNVYTNSGLTIPASGYPLTGTTVTSPCTITGLTSGVTYWYTVTAVDPACNSVASASNYATTSVIACSGTPTAGTATSTAAMVTGSAAFTLGLAGASGETGITFQWQSSSCENSWTNISGVTGSYFYPTSESASTFYRCNVTCTNSGVTSPSAPVYVEEVATAYCNPGSASGCTGGDGVNAFTLAGECGTAINDPGPMLCGATNTDHTGYAPAVMYAGSTYAATVNSNFDGDDVYVWIDFDNSGTFDASEIVYSTTTGDVSGAPFFYSFNIPIPAITAGASPALHRMRVVVNNSQTLFTGCDALVAGTSVDYMVQILPNAALTANSPLCLPGSLTLTAGPAVSCGAVYTWSGPAGYAATTTNINTVSPPAAAGVYSVTVAVNGLASCPSPATANVIIYYAPTISGIAGMCIGSTTTLNGTPAGGNWTSSNPAVASVGTGTGLVSGISLGSSNISYSIPATGCSASSPIAITLTPALYAVTGGGSICAGAPGVHIGVNNSGSGVSYQLYNSGVPAGSPVRGTGSALDFGAVTAGGSYTVVANPGSSCATTMTGSATVIVNPLPNIYPMTGGGSYCPGGAGVVVGLAGSDPAVNYQLFQGSTLLSGTLAGTGAPLSFGTQTAVGYYNVLAVNPVTGCSAYMAPSAAVSLKPLPIPFPVTGGGAYCAGGTGVDIGLGGSAPGVSYRLYFGGAPVGAPINGTGSAIDFGLQTGAGVYTIVATDAVTTCTLPMTGSATVSINPAPLSFSVTGGGAFCSGAAGVHVGLSGSVIGTSYLLYNGSMVTGGASGTSAPLDFGLETGAGAYTVIATNTSTGCLGPMTGSVAVTVNPAPAAFTPTGGGSYCAGGGGVPVGLSGSVTGTNYSILGSGIPLGTIPGTGSALGFGTFTAPGLYTVVASVAATGCTAALPGSVLVSVNPLPPVQNVTGGGSYCAGGPGAHVGLDGSGAGVSYQLLNAGAPAGAMTPGTGGALDFGLQTSAGAYTVSATDNLTGCSGSMNRGAAIVANAAPAAYTVAGGGSYCFGGSGFAVTLGGSDIGTNYQLYFGTTPAGSPLAGTGSPLNFGAQTMAGAYTVAAMNVSTGCRDTMPGSAVITVTPLPAVFSVTGGGNYCSGGAGVHIGLSGSAAGVSYQLYLGTVVAGAPIPGSGTAVDFGPQTTGGSFTVIATDGGGCSNTMAGSAFITVTVNPLPLPLAVTGGGSYCSGGAGVHTGLATSVPGVSYQLYNGFSGMGAPVPGTGGALDFGLQTIAGNYTVVGAIGTTGCAGNRHSIC